MRRKRGWWDAMGLPLLYFHSLLSLCISPFKKARFPLSWKQDIDEAGMEMEDGKESEREIPGARQWELCLSFCFTFSICSSLPFPLLLARKKTRVFSSSGGKPKSWACNFPLEFNSRQQPQLLYTVEIFIFFLSSSSYAFLPLFPLPFHFSVFLLLFRWPVEVIIQKQTTFNNKRVIQNVRVWKPRQPSEVLLLCTLESLSRMCFSRSL